MNSLKLRVTQMALVKFRGPQDKTKEHGCGRQVGAGLPGSGESYEKEQVGCKQAPLCTSIKLLNEKINKS